jgi:hypothetical protein
MPVAVSGALCKCSFGVAPSPLNILPKLPIFICGLPVAVITDFVPMVNISPFGVCSSPSNPTVASATAAALGVLTPMPCVPAVVAPWIPSKPMIITPVGPAVCGGDSCMCMWGGLITIAFPGQAVVL